ncbi:MAG TPA: hypothetical protein VHR45_24960 [Thermoanaerobaculia bacterium]|nr:hypothetical protein [Thermoanaerobaculia bacterium]
MANRSALHQRIDELADRAVYWFWRLRATVFFGLPGLVLLIDRDKHPSNLGLGLLLVSTAAVFLAVNLAIYRRDRRRATGAQAPAGAQDPAAYAELQAKMARLREAERRP